MTDRRITELPDGGDLDTNDVLAGVRNNTTYEVAVKEARQDGNTYKPGLMSAADKEKLDGIAEGATGVNVQSDWNEGNASAPAFIRNKPVVSGLNESQVDGRVNTLVENFAKVGNGAQVAAGKLPDATTGTKGAMSAADKAKLNGIQAGAQVNVQSDWNVTDTTSKAYIANKPAQGLAQVATETPVSGDGTAASPVTIEDGTITASKLAEGVGGDAGLSLTSDVLNAVRQLPRILPHANQPVIWSGKFKADSLQHPVNANLQWKGFYDPPGDQEHTFGEALDQPPLVGSHFTTPESQAGTNYILDAAYFTITTGGTPSFFIGFSPDLASSQTSLRFIQDLRVAVVDWQGVKVFDNRFSAASYIDTGGRQEFWWNTTGSPFADNDDRQFEVIIYQSASEQTLANLHDIVYSPLDSEYADSDAFYWKASLVTRTNGIDTGYVSPQDDDYANAQFGETRLEIQPINGVELFSDAPATASYTFLRAVANFAQNRLEIGISPHDEDNLTLREDVRVAIVAAGTKTFDKKLIWFSAGTQFWSYPIDPNTDHVFGSTNDDLDIYIYRSPDRALDVNEIEQLKLTNIDHYLGDRLEKWADTATPDVTIPRARLPEAYQVSERFYQNVFTPEAQQQVAGMLATFDRGSNPVVFRREFVASTSGGFVGWFNDSQVLNGQDNEISGALLTAQSPYNGRTYNIEMFRRDDEVVGGTDHELVLRFGGGNNGDISQFENNQISYNRFAIFNADQQVMIQRQMLNGVAVGSNSNEIEHSLLNDNQDFAFVDGDRYIFIIYNSQDELTAGQLLLGGVVENPLKTSSSATVAGLSETKGLTEAAVRQLINRMVIPAAVRDDWE